MQIQILSRPERLMRYAHMGGVAQIEKGRMTPERPCVLRHPPFIKKASDRTPDSVLSPPSLSAPQAQAAPGLAGITRHRRRGGDASERGSANALRLPPGSPPHAPCSPSASAVA